MHELHKIALLASCHNRPVHQKLQLQCHTCISSQNVSCVTHDMGHADTRCSTEPASSVWDDWRKLRVPIEAETFRPGSLAERAKALTLAEP